MKNVCATILFLSVPFWALALPAGEVSQPSGDGRNAVQNGGGYWSTDCGNFGAMQRWYFPVAAPVGGQTVVPAPASPTSSRQKRQAFMGAGGGAAASSSASSASASGMGTMAYPYGAYAMPYGYPYYGGFFG